MEKLYDICAKTGTYEQNGQTRTRFLNVGSQWINDEGHVFQFMHAHFNPAAIERKPGSEDIILYLFPPKDRQQKQQQPQSQTQSQPQRQQQQTQQNPNDFTGWPEIPF